MIYSIKGEIAQKQQNYAVIVSNNIGYKLNITFNTYKSMGDKGDTVTLFTYLHVREDILDLYGFHNKVEEEWFRTLISVSGIGPKAGLAILSELTPNQLMISIMNEDFKTLTMCKGIGPKIAKRAILELKDKVKKIDISGSDDFSVSIDSSVQLEGNQSQEAMAALMALGYSMQEASGIIMELDQTLTVEELIKSALKKLAGKV